MKIEYQNKNGNLNVTLEGRLDTISAPEFERIINANCGGIQALTIDCEKLVYISSAGLRVLLSAQKKMKGSMKLTNVCELVMEVFEMTGFADILVIE
ncbi:MAG: STAS domain-containing protein [Clostridia bacterium]|nr:STAS domain-containing protein [Clostridia bacterium]